jgi:hypothetical protein
MRYNGRSMTQKKLTQKWFKNVHIQRGELDEFGESFQPWLCFYTHFLYFLPRSRLA